MILMVPVNAGAVLIDASWTVMLSAAGDQKMHAIGTGACIYATLACSVVGRQRILKGWGNM